ncbi:FAD-dependent oxidoreductase [Cognatiyoonia sp. IB215182]|uniref:FAD-dependent oxidoreductase n=1 Tax=Cognatiyoonia sp. IB215182 TaxID=3097353 RepID=UPI002A1166AA|nr:FAD-dependent oxidoreductase [Cognatiyoonia sp. IB215182]MDX8352964.1 3-hydroxyacyl-CoA dehydrogenase NAD-binding domain-containing protein [Cognatiyoonia sp. IB215182]
MKERRDLSDLVRTEIRDGIGWVTLDNPPVNATSTAVRAELLEAVGKVQRCELAVLSCAGKTFVAGGDMSEFDAPPQEPHLPDVTTALENSATPFVALMHGNVLGGGFEIAMACAFRVARPGTRFGLPEVNVGLIPGAGGTQRAPRLLGWEMAFQMACLGKTFTAEALFAAGAIDLVADNPEATIAQFKGHTPERVSERAIAPIPPSEIARFKAQAREFAKGRAAPLHNLTALTWASQPFAEAQPKERALHLELRKSEESIALRHIFFAERAVTRPATLQGIAPHDLAHIAIIGGGLMGSGIAAASLIAGYKVTLIERDRQAADAARATVTKLLQGALDRGKITRSAFDAQIDALTTTDTYEAATDADLAIEAVFEDLDAKRAVFAALTRVVGPQTLLATNTSYLDPNAIFAGIDKPERCLGIHFFSPAHIMKLVEVVKADHTGDHALATAFAFAGKLRKTPVLAGVFDGFIGNRILSAYRRAAEYMLADGALPQQIDAAMRAFGMAMGPFEAQDMAGLQIAQANRQRQDATRNPDERYVTISDKLCDMGRFGRRAGAGWYAYPDGAKTGQPDPLVDELIAAYRHENGLTPCSFSETDIQTQLLAAMANEGARIVDEGIAENAAAVDVVKTSGYGFPRWRGGPMHWAETIGMSEVRSALDALEAASPGSWQRAKAFQNGHN